MTDQQRLKRFTVIAKLYKRREQQVALRNRNIQQALIAEKQQLDTLNSLFNEYQASAMPIIGAVQQPKLMSIQSQFIRSLQGVREKQALSTQVAEERFQRATKKVLLAKQRTDAIDVLVRNLKRNVAYQIDLREQALMDDLAAYKNYSDN
ncbi:MAG: flagellar export protein FliJ [Pseudomonadales bacterium]|nr:flagellar export protein FliJ [Pseudomonadales bacterium]